jgi:hypothetical protein
MIQQLCAYIRAQGPSEKHMLGEWWRAFAISSMFRYLPTIAATAALFEQCSSQQFQNSTTESVKLHWISGSAPSYSSGTTFGLPWARGKHFPNSTVFGLSDSESDLQSWVTAYWNDGSIKWTGHAVPAVNTSPENYIVTASPGSGSSTKAAGIETSESSEGFTVDTGKIQVSFPKSGNSVIGEIKTSSGKVVGQNGKLVLHTQSGVNDDIGSRGNASIEYYNFESNIDNVTISESSQTRTLVTVRGKHHIADGGAHADWLPFVLRFYLYANSDAIRLIHTFVFDGKSDEDFISGMGVRFSVPLADEELYNRHVRIAGVDGGMLSEAVKGITGLRRDPGQAVRTAQFNGRETPSKDTWDTRVSSRLHWIPDWNDYTLSQLSPDGFELKKRTKPGRSWIKIPGSTRSGGLAYLGGATQGGLAVGVRNFWKHYPVGLDIRNAAGDSGEITAWLYSPEAQPLDTRPYHDGLGQETYAEQLDALEITYEDWEDGFDTPYGVARTNELYIYAFDRTPPQDHLSTLIEHTNNPPVLYAEPGYVHETKAAGTWWSPPLTNTSSGVAAQIESNLEFLAKFYQDQVEQRRWYGFFDFGDFMHTQDVDRHSWRYDVGGYAWVSQFFFSSVVVPATLEYRDYPCTSEILMNRIEYLLTCMFPHLLGQQRAVSRSVLLASIPPNRWRSYLPFLRGSDPAHWRSRCIPPGTMGRLGYQARRPALGRLCKASPHLDCPVPKDLLLYLRRR